MFNNFEKFKHKSKLNKFQVEDLFLKRDKSLPNNIIDEIEKEQQLRNQQISLANQISQDRLHNKKNS